MGNVSKMIKLVGQKEATENLKKIGCNAKFVDKSFDFKEIVKNPNCELYRQCLEIVAHVMPPVANFTCIECKKCETQDAASGRKKGIRLSSHF
ncbi:MAG TPA: hypothetical protein EYP21_10500 [Syntrophaceae bacterium]|nr:hypothetical protein [Syntrophaceae bacterium]